VVHGLLPATDYALTVLRAAVLSRAASVELIQQVACEISR
jgi:hypothetical protein